MLSLLDALVKPLKSQSSLKSAVFNYKKSFSLFFYTAHSRRLEGHLTSLLWPYSGMSEECFV